MFEFWSVDRSSIYLKTNKKPKVFRLHEKFMELNALVNIVYYTFSTKSLEHLFPKRDRFVHFGITYLLARGDSRIRKTNSLTNYSVELIQWKMNNEKQLQTFSYNKFFSNQLRRWMLSTSVDIYNYTVNVKISFVSYVAHRMYDQLSFYSCETFLFHIVCCWAVSDQFSLCWALECSE